MTENSNQQMNLEEYDLVIVGGGINGAGIARDAAGRGYKVLLVEKDDLAAHTSSASSKLIHGGLRYLEFYEFKLVREALNEREVLLSIAPHIIWPLRFILPHNKKMRPAWMIRIGLWIYDHLGKRKKLPVSRGVNFQHHDSGLALNKPFKKGFAYSDCWVQDARLVVLNAMDAKDKGATILTHTKCESAQAINHQWQVNLVNDQGHNFSVKAKLLVNASGPWVAQFLSENLKLDDQHSIRLVSGGHIIVPKLFDHHMAYIFQNTDNRIVFAIPYERNFTLIGTTENDVSQAQASPITDKEINYLCQTVNQYFKHQISAEDVVWSYSGVRPLVEDGSNSATSTTREYRLDLVNSPAPCLSVFGGKITTFRSLAENALAMIDDHFAKPVNAWTAGAPLPGGDMPGADFETYLNNFQQQYPWLPDDLAWHYIRNYGTKAEIICDSMHRLDDLGQDFGEGLYQCEVDYLIKHEWARCADDILWRRSKWGLHTTSGTQKRLAEYLSDN